MVSDCGNSRNEIAAVAAALKKIHTRQLFKSQRGKSQSALGIR